MLKIPLRVFNVSSSVKRKLTAHRENITNITCLTGENSWEKETQTDWLFPLALLPPERNRWCLHWKTTVFLLHRYQISPLEMTVSSSPLITASPWIAYTGRHRLSSYQQAIRKKIKIKSQILSLSSLSLSSLNSEKWRSLLEQPLAARIIYIIMNYYYIFVYN